MIRRLLRLLAFGVVCAFVVVLVVPCLRGQTAIEPVPEHDVTGTVINSVTRQPIGRALVKINGGRATFTDREGRFKFSDVKEQGFNLRAEKPGYFEDQGRPGRYRSLQRVVGIGPSVANEPGEPVTIELVPEAILFGVVTDAGGVPLPAVQLTLQKAVVQNGLIRWIGVGVATSMSSGEFRFANLAAGEYRLTTSFHLESFFRGDDHEGYLPARYPEGGGAITLAAGQQKTIDVTQRAEKLYRVTGSLHGKKAGQGVNLTAVTPLGDEVQPIQVESRGPDTFGVLLPNGAYQLKAAIYDGSTTLMASSSVAVGGHAVGDVALNFLPLATFPIEIEREPSTTSNSTPDALTSQAHTISQLVSLNPNVQLQYSAQSMDGTPQGPLGFSGVEPGRYLFTAESDGPWHVTSATCGSIDLMREPLIVVGGAAGCTVHAVFSDAFADVTVSAVKDGKAADAFVYFVPVPSLSTYLPQNLITVDNPSMTANLAPGRYEVLAIDTQQDLEYRNPEAMQRYAQYTRSITLAPGQSATLQLDVATAEK